MVAAATIKRTAEALNNKSKTSGWVDVMGGSIKQKKSALAMPPEQLKATMRSHTNVGRM